MSLYIKGLDMPNSGQVELVIRPHGKVFSKTLGIGKLEAIQIPTPHGRLIDGDELADIVDGTDWYHINRKGELVDGAGVEDEALYKADDILTTVNNAPTILEAEKE